MSKMEKLKLIELCSGIGAQIKGIQNTELFDVESVATADLDKEVVVSYAAMHCGLTKDLIYSYKDYPSKEQMVKELSQKRLGYDFKNDVPYDWAKLARKKDISKGIEKYWLADQLSKNLGDMTQIKELPDCDLLSYSAPCTDLSFSGRQEGLGWTCQDCQTKYDPADMSVADRYTCPHCGSHNIKSTRSGLLYEVERLLVKAKENGNLPTFLLMENVDALVSKKFIGSFNDWIQRLENLGYSSYYQVINARDAGVPQNRKRIFVVSILQGKDTGKFTFPEPFDIGIRLKDVLENDVDERYYLSQDKVSKLLTNIAYHTDTNSYTLNGFPIPFNNKNEVKACVAMRGRNPQNPSDRTVGVHTEQRLELNLTDTTNCLTTVSKDNLILEGFNGSDNKCIQVGNVADERENFKNPQIGRIYSTDGISSTLNTCNGGSHEPKVLFGIDKSYNIPKPIDIANCLTTKDRGVSHRKAEGTAVVEYVEQENAKIEELVSRLKIRKLTPMECHRLMGFDDIDYERCQAVGVSDAQGYKQAGNSIVTNVIGLIAEHLYKAQYDDSYVCTDENFTKPQAE